LLDVYIIVDLVEIVKSRTESSRDLCGSRGNFSSYILTDRPFHDTLA